MEKSKKVDKSLIIVKLAQNLQISNKSEESVVHQYLGAFTTTLEKFAYLEYGIFLDWEFLRA